MWQWLSNNWPNILQIGVFVIAIGGGVIGRVFNEVRKQRILREQQLRLAREREEALRTGRGEDVGARAEPLTKVRSPDRVVASPAMAAAPQAGTLSTPGRGAGAGSASRSGAGSTAAAARNAELARRRQEAAERFRQELERRRAQQRASSGQSSSQSSSQSTGQSAQQARPAGSGPDARLVSQPGSSQPGSSQPGSSRPGSDAYASTSDANAQAQLAVLMERRLAARAAGSPGSSMKTTGLASSAAFGAQGNATGLRALLKNPNAVRQAILLNELLGPPKSLQKESPTT